MKHKFSIQHSTFSISRMLIVVALLALLGWSLIPSQTAPVAAQGNRLVMKNGDLTVMVMSMDTETAVTRAIDYVNNYNGYVLSQRTWQDGDGFRYATLTAGVPVDQFEALMALFKGLGLVQSESISGQDVTDRSVDLGSRISNLDANQTRTRGFLDQTTSITETLHVFQTLRQLEGQVGDLQGQQNYLTDRSAVATVTLQLLPFIPTPTPSPTATPTPLPTPQGWRPGDTAETATTLLQNNAQSTADFFIYNSIVCGPWLLLLALVGVPFGRWAWPKVKRRRKI
ncbi:MAG: DUF4349 domain-containing protein [Ardenticatenaceae bacterium]|nr:DUF4349 domain-containing protein [Anaerolineales bacterium]MCB8921076.1 DUF4349 domain-containing protein [Ardenticatenaceae bacterium]MCB9005369.1 DUF4349 domain-containing protein [Ardenticatenaceae bacterium]